MYCEKCGNQIDENTKLCQNCGNNLREAQETIVEPAIAPNTKEKKSNMYSILSIVFASIGLIPLLNILFVPVSVILAVIGLVTGKNKGAKIKIVSVIVLVISIIISLVWMVPSITGSSTDPFTNNGSENQNTPTVCSHKYSDATCTEPQTCDKCGATNGSALGHTTSTGTCTRCGVSFSKWEKRYYVDEFNNPTSNAFIAPTDKSYGTFSNSATTNSKLTAYVRVNSDDCEIMLWEYGSIMVKASSTTDYDITILLPNGTKKDFSGTMYKNGTVICFDNYSEIIALLKNTDGILKFYIKEDSDYGVNSTYLFEVNTSGFKTLYNQTFN